MKIGKRRTWLFLAALMMAFSLVAVICWSAALHGPPQIITFSDGSQYRFAGANWGTNHSQPGLLAQVVDHLPKRWAAYVRAKMVPRAGLIPPIHTEPALVVWLEPIRTNAPGPPPASGVLNFTANLSDERGIVAGTRNLKTISPGAPLWTWLEFDQLPRRSRNLEVRLMEVDVGERGKTRDLGSIKFPNPRFGQFPQWQPEALPVEKSAGDVLVRLTSLSTNLSRDAWGENWETQFSAAIESSHGTNEGWAVADAELSDATGNSITQSFNGASGSYAIPGTLWPGESAWRLRLGLKRTSRYPVTDLITFTNLPVLNAGSSMGPRPTNSTSLTNFVGGIPIVVRNSTDIGFWFGFPPGPYWVELELPQRSPDLAVDIVEVVTDTGEKLTMAGSGWNAELSYWNFNSMPAGAKFLTVTVAAQKKRFVEFLAKPAQSP